MRTVTVARPTRIVASNAALVSGIRTKAMVPQTVVATVASKAVLIERIRAERFAAAPVLSLATL
jgi:hypothetical protein